MKKLIFIFSAFVFFSITIYSQTPQTISFQGVATDNSGSNLPDGNYMMIFKLYNTASGGGALWNETQNVTVNDGVFNVVLGSVNPLDVSFDEQYWLGVKVESDPELEPRIQFTASPYAFTAATVEDGAVTESKIANAAVAESKIADGAVTQSKLADGITAVPSGTAEGDLKGEYPGPTVVGIQNVNIASAAPSAGQVLKFDGTYWAPGADNTGGGSLWSANGSNVYYNGGNVGIGTANPGAGLDIYSEILPSLRLSGFPTSSAWEILVNSSGLTFYRESGGGHDFVITNNGDVKVQNGDLIVTHEIQRGITGNANLTPIAYGVVGSNGTIYDGSTDNFSVSVIGTGIYDVLINGENYYFTNYVTECSVIDSSPAFITNSSLSGKLRIYTFNSSGTATDKAFSFVVYRK